MKELVSFPLFALGDSLPISSFGNMFLSYVCVVCITLENFCFPFFWTFFYFHFYYCYLYTFSTLPSSPHLPIHYKAYYFVTFFFGFYLPMVGGDLENFGNEKIEFSLNSERNLNMHAIAIF